MMTFTNSVYFSETSLKSAVVFAQLRKHVFWLDKIGIVVQDTLHPGYVPNGANRRSSDLANPLCNGVRHGEQLIRLFIEKQVIVAKVWPAHMPVEVLGFQIEREYV